MAQLDYLGLSNSIRGFAFQLSSKVNLARLPYDFSPNMLSGSHTTPGESILKAGLATIPTLNLGLSFISRQATSPSGYKIRCPTPLSFFLAESLLESANLN